MLKLYEAEAPAEEPITIDEAKLHLRVDGDDEDAHIMNLITAARMEAERVTWRAFCERTFVLNLDAWPGESCIALPRAPLRSVESVIYTSDAGVATTMASSDYIVSAPGNERGLIALKRQSTGWPTTTLQVVDGIELRFTAGYGDPSDVPQLFKQAMLLMIGHWYENREEVVITPGVVAVEVPLAAQGILFNNRAW